MKYKVLIQHFGDCQYWAGESREVANEQDAKELIKLGLIAPFDDDGDNGEQDNPPAEPKQKSKAPPKNKAEGEPENKGEE